MAAPAICLSQGATSLAANQVPSVSGRVIENTYSPTKIQLQPRLALSGRSEIKLMCNSQPLHGYRQPVTRKQEARNKQSIFRKRACRAVEGGAGVADEQERENVDLPPVPAGQMMVPYMKKGYGAYGGGATLEKSKLSLSSSQTKTSPQVCPPVMVGWACVTRRYRSFASVKFVIRWTLHYDGIYHCILKTGHNLSK